MNIEKKTIKEDFSIIENFISALNIEFEESKKRNIENKNLIENQILE